MGTVACQSQFDKVVHYIELAKQEGGARLAAGGVRPTQPELSRGLFVRPSVFTDVTNDMRIARAEIFGHVAVLIRFADEDDAAQIANDTAFDLPAGVWTRDVARAHRMASRLGAGNVWMNNYRRRTTSHHSAASRTGARERLSCHQGIHRDQDGVD